MSGPSSLAVSRLMSKLLAYLQLCRAANVFTAMADIFLGYLLTHDSLQPGVNFGLLLAASSSLYLAGMVWNDVFDREVDARERPERPIPSGRVRLQMAVVLGTVLIAAGCNLALAAGKQSALVAAALVACIVLYDGLLKATPLGPVLMGCCRFLNVMLGASTAADVWALPQLHVAAALGVYIAGVTWFARHEAEKSHRTQLAAAMGIVNLGLALLVAFVLNWPVDIAGQRYNAALFLGVITAIIDRRLLAALWNPSPRNVQVSIKTMLLSLVMLDASVIAFVQPDITYAMIVVGLLAPALVLARFLAVT